MSSSHICSMDKSPKSRRTDSKSDQASDREELRQLFDGVAENDGVGVGRLLELVPKKSLSELLAPCKRAKNPKRKAVHAKATAVAESLDPCWMEWMNTACMPWNPCRSFNATSYRFDAL